MPGEPRTRQLSSVVTWKCLCLGVPDVSEPKEGAVAERFYSCTPKAVPAEVSLSPARLDTEIRGPGSSGINTLLLHLRGARGAPGMGAGTGSQAAAQHSSKHELWL